MAINQTVTIMLTSTNNSTAFFKPQLPLSGDHSWASDASAESQERLQPQPVDLGAEIIVKQSPSTGRWFVKFVAEGHGTLFSNWYEAGIEEAEAVEMAFLDLEAEGGCNLTPEDNYLKFDAE